jgi:hypothetical protein
MGVHTTVKPRTRTPEMLTRAGVIKLFPLRVEDGDLLRFEGGSLPASGEGSQAKTAIFP